MDEPMTEEHFVVGCCAGGSHDDGPSIATTPVVSRCVGFAGGHVEVSEVPSLALTRELQEELGTTAEVAAGDQFAKRQCVDFRMDIWTIEEWTGEPSNCSPEEHDAPADR
jgi:8-oxo-dGTP pyrophosphatase MutT (NUDIX family)